MGSERCNSEIEETLHRPRAKHTLTSTNSDKIAFLEELVVSIDPASVTSSYLGSHLQQRLVAADALDWDAPGDSDNPVNWSAWKRYWHVVPPSIIYFSA